MHLPRRRRFLLRGAALHRRLGATCNLRIGVYTGNRAALPTRLRVGSGWLFPVVLPVVLRSGRTGPITVRPAVGVLRDDLVPNGPIGVGASREFAISFRIPDLSESVYAVGSIDSGLCLSVTPRFPCSMPGVSRDDRSKDKIGVCALVFRSRHARLTMRRSEWRASSPSLCFDVPAETQSGSAGIPMVDYAFNRVGLPRLVGGAFPENERSVKLQKRLGFSVSRDSRGGGHGWVTVLWNPKG